MAAARGLGQITFQGHKLALYQDLAILPLQKRWDFRPVTEFLTGKQVHYSWGHPFRLIFVWEDWVGKVKTVQVARRILSLQADQKKPENDEDAHPTARSRFSRPSRWKKQRATKRPARPSHETVVAEQ